MISKNIKNFIIFKKIRKLIFKGEKEMSLISVKNLTFGYDGDYINIFENISFNIDTYWK